MTYFFCDSGYLRLPSLSPVLRTQTGYRCLRLCGIWFNACCFVWVGFWFWNAVASSFVSLRCWFTAHIATVFLIDILLSWIYLFFYWLNWNKWLVLYWAIFRSQQIGGRYYCMKYGYFRSCCRSIRLGIWAQHALHLAVVNYVQWGSAELGSYLLRRYELIACFSLFGLKFHHFHCFTWNIH